MAMIWMCGGEWGSKLEFDLADNAPATTYKRSGGYSMSINQSQVLKTLSTNLTEAYVQVAIYTNTSWGANVRFINLMKDGAIAACIDCDSAARLRVYKGDRSTLLLTGTTSLQNQRWYVVELHLKIDGSVGVAELRLDGNAEGSFSGNTLYSTYTYFNQFWGYWPPSAPQVWIDDVVINDITGAINNSWPNGMKIVLLKPTSDGATLEWTATPGAAHYTGVDEIPASATDNVKVTTNDKLDLYGYEDLPAEAQSIKAVAFDSMAFKASLTAPTQLAHVPVIGGTPYEQTTKQLGLAQGLVRTCLETSPAGGNWDVATVNALIAGPKSKA